MLRLLAFLESIPRPIVALAIGFGYATLVRWTFRWYMLIDAALIVLYLSRPALGLLAWVALLMIVRHVPTLARDVASMLKLHEYEGWTLRAVLFALPALQSDAIVMSRSDGAPSIDKTIALVHVPVPGTADTKAVPPVSRDITRDEWIGTMASALDEKGAFMFSANKIYAAVGGHRKDVLDIVRAIQDGGPPAQFRQDDGATGPADFPVTKQ